jgi:NitT/TauT family transport system ATP-binding protein
MTDFATEALGAPPAASALSFRNVSKVFRDGTHAVDDVSLDVSPGEFVAIVGPSGCGKSTLLRIAAGLSAATSGSADARIEDVGYVFQDATLLPWRTVQRNVELPAQIHKLPRAERAARAREALELTGLQGFEQHRPRSLSGGMRMRVSLARALTMRPKVFLFDEPFGALDEITRERLNDELLRLFLHEHFAGLFVTHSVTEAVYLATRVVVMSPRPGRIVSETAVPFAYPRSPELRFDPAFTAIAAAVSADMRSVTP